MANTGTKIVLSLKQVANPGENPTGLTKENLSNDPNYIAPYEDLTDCPVAYDLACVTVLFTRTTNTLTYEFNLPNTVVENPVVLKVRVALSVGGFVHTYDLPHTPSPNYFSGVFTGLTGATDYNIVITYLGTSDTVLATCNTDVP